MADFFGTGPQTTTSTTNLGFATPYIDRLMYSAESQSQKAYTPYGGQRVAQAAPLQQQAFTQASQMGLPSQFQQSTDIFNQAARAGQGLGSFAPGSFQGGYNPTTFNAGYSAPSQQEYEPFIGYQAGTFSQQDFGFPQAQQYMSPYQQAVTDIQRREADTAFQKQQNQLRLGAAQRGAFGGSRSTLLESEAQRAQGQLQNDIQARGLQEAYNNAQQQFNADRQRRFAVEQAQEQARLSGRQFGLQGLTAREQARQQAGQMGLQAQQLGDQSQQFGSRFGLDKFQANEQARQQAANLMLQGNQQALSAAQGLGSLGAQQAESERQRINQLSQLGGDMRGIQQQGLDVDYANFLEQRDYGKKQLEFLKNMYAGLPVAQQSQQTEPGANLLNQLLSTGLGGASILKILGMV